MSFKYLYIENKTKKTLGDVKSLVPSPTVWTFKDSTPVAAGQKL